MDASIPDATAGPPLFETPRLTATRLGSGDGEARALQAVFEAAGDYFLSITGQPRPDPDAAERELRGAATTPGRATALLALRQGGEAVGALGWWESNPEPDIALVGMILVVPDARKQGLAREALGGLEGWLAAQGITRLRTGVGAGDRQRHALLRSLGFSELDQRTHVSLDRGRIMLALFEKQLGAAE